MLTVPEVLQNTKAYRQTWVILTMIWGIYQLILAIMMMILLHTVSVTVYFTIIMISNVFDLGLIMFSFWFGKWYMERSGVITAGN